MTTPTFAASKDVHRTLIRIFDPWFKGHGFVRKTSAKCAYQRPLDSRPDQLIAFEVQCSSWGSSDSGSMFALNAGAGITHPSATGYRLLNMLDAATRKQGREIARQIRQRHASTVTSAWPDWHWNPDHQDPWCQYFDAADVERWGHFLLPHVPDMLDRLLALRELPPEPALHAGSD